MFLWENVEILPKLFLFPGALLRFQVQQALVLKCTRECERKIGRNILCTGIHGFCLCILECIIVPKID